MPPRSLRRPIDWLPRAIVAGFTATIVLLAVHLVGYAVLLLAELYGPTSTISHRTMAGWLHALVYNHLTDPAQPALYLAFLLQIILGIGGGVVYAAVVEPRFREPEWLRGLIFGVATWVGTLVILLPALGAGFFGSALGAGPLPIYATLLAHLAYGVILGISYSATDDIAVLGGDPAVDRPLSFPSALAAASGWGRSAAGAVVGAIIGAVLGLALGMVIPWHGSFVPAAVFPFALMLAAALAGAGLGELIGSLSALPSASRQERRV
jgi:hypothetical protein